MNEAHTTARAKEIGHVSPAVGSRDSLGRWVRRRVSSGGDARRRGLPGGDDPHRAVRRRRVDRGDGRAGPALHPQRPRRHRREALVRPAARSTDGHIIATQRRSRLPGRPAPRRPALRLLARGSTASTRCRWSPSRRARSATSTPATASRCSRARRSAAWSTATTSRTPARSSADRPRPRPRRPARPAAGDPARRRLRHQPRPVRRHHRGRRLPPRTSRAATSWKSSSAGRRNCSEVDGFNPVVIGGLIETHRPAHARARRSSSTRIGIVTVHDGPSLAPGEIIAPVGRQRRRRRQLPQQLPGPRSVPRGRRPARPAVRAAHRRHLLHQPLVRHRRDHPQDGRAHRLRRRGRQLLRPDRARTSPATPSATASASPAASAASGTSRFGPGKYPFNTYAGQIILVPTTNFVLHWITGKTEVAPLRRQPQVASTW